MRLLKTFILTLAIFFTGTSIIWAGEIPQKPLEEAFNNSIIVPFDYHGKIFLNGKKSDIYGDYKLYLRNNRVLVPIRLMGNLASNLDGNTEHWNYWDVRWDPLKPDDVVLVNYQKGIESNKTVKLKVNSNIIYIDNEPQTVDVPPQKIDGRIVLPIRSTTEALDMKIHWLDGLIIMSNESIDLQSPNNLEIKDKIKSRLADDREEVDYEQRVMPITKYEDTIYYYKTKYQENGPYHRHIDELYSKTGTQPEVRIPLPGELRLGEHKIFAEELYYISTIDGKSELHIFNFADNKSRKLCSLGDWHQDDGWLADMRYVNNEFYVTLHYGDNTMGGEALYKLKDGVLEEVVRAKNFINFVVEGEDVYYTNFQPMNWTNNLLKVNVQTKGKENLAHSDFIYGISRTIQDGYGVSYSGNRGLFIQDGYLYALGYNESDEGDRASVYKISIEDQSQTKLTLPARVFWLVDDKIYYIDLDTDYLVRVDLDGNNKITLIENRIINIEVFNENIYYTSTELKGNFESQTGKLYKYNMATGQDIKLTDKPVSEIYVGNLGAYYISEGFDLGLYKIDPNNSSEILVDDSIYSALLTDEGIVYTLRYEEGVYIVK